MRSRIVVPLVLLALALPYARAPICQAGTHDHGTDHPAAGDAFDVPEHGSTHAGPCHELMGCGSVTVAAEGRAASTLQDAPRLPEQRSRLDLPPASSPRSPESPPPRSV